MLLLEALLVSGALQIGTLAKQSGLTVDAIRFYERQGLLARPKRSEGGFRLFGADDLTALHFIKSAQGLGFSLDEIRQLLSVRSEEQNACPKMSDLLRTKLATVETKIASLKIIRTELKSALQKCEGALETSFKHACPVLEGISGKLPNGRTG